MQELPSLTGQRLWLITGVAGFIGSNLLQFLLASGQKVVGLDNFSTGHRANLDEVRAQVGEANWAHFTLIEGDIVDFDTCVAACRGVDLVLHQAALGSVPRSIEDPLRTHASNIDGFLNVLEAARRAGVSRFVYAASSSTYGDHPALPKVESVIGKPLSPYAVTKYVNELYAEVYTRTYGIETVGLRYFNVFGPRQDPDGAYAAVIPKWFGTLLRGGECFINGDGETSRDFCFIDNVVSANLLAATTSNTEAVGEVFNIACGCRTTLNGLYGAICDLVAQVKPEVGNKPPVYRDFRSGDVRHSLADISKAQRILGYQPLFGPEAGLARASSWYINKYQSLST